MEMKSIDECYNLEGSQTAFIPKRIIPKNSYSI